MVIRIIRHAFAIIFNNFGQALRISALPYLSMVAIGFAVALNDPGLVEIDSDLYLDGSSDGIFEINTISIVLALASAIYSLFVLGWIAVSWHRFILLEERQGWIPVVNYKLINAYLVRSIGYGLLLCLIAVVLMVILSAVGLHTLLDADPDSMSFDLFLATAVIGTILTFIWYSIALALPSIALSEPISMREAWSASSGINTTIFGISSVLVILNQIGLFITNDLLWSLPLIAALLGAIVNWITILVGVSILTTLYGHLIEDRPLIE